MSHLYHGCQLWSLTFVTIGSCLSGNGRQGQFHCQDMGNNGLDMVLVVGAHAVPWHIPLRPGSMGANGA